MIATTSNILFVRNAFFCSAFTALFVAHFYLMFCEASFLSLTTLQISNTISNGFVLDFVSKAENLQGHPPILNHLRTLLGRSTLGVGGQLGVQSA